MARYPESTVSGDSGPARRRKTWLARILACLLLVAAVLAVAWLWLGQRRASAEEYARHATVDVTQAWDVEALASRASASLLEETPVDELSRILSFLESQLGCLVQVHQAKATGILIGLSSTTMTVRVTAAFERGDGSIIWVLLRDGASWRVRSVSFDSDHIRLPLPEGEDGAMATPPNEGMNLSRRWG